LNKKRVNLKFWSGVGDMAGVVTGSTDIKGFTGTSSLPKVKYSVTMADGTIRDVVVTLQGHHVIPQNTFKNNPFLQALKVDGTFDGNSFAQPA
jgi:hypothetical protein